MSEHEMELGEWSGSAVSLPVLRPARRPREHLKEAHGDEEEPASASGVITAATLRRAPDSTARRTGRSGQCWSLHCREGIPLIGLHQNSGRTASRRS